MVYHVLYNPLSGSGEGYTRIGALRDILRDGEQISVDIREIPDCNSFIRELPPEDAVVIAGGDGTLNRFLNSVDAEAFTRSIYYYAVGNGNDFKHDVDPDGNGLIPLREYVSNLPTVCVKGKTYRFLNGIGYGIDGYCCEVGDAMLRKSEKKVNYAGIAIKGLLFHYKATRADVTVDGKTHRYDKVWLAPTMKGRFYGGGMMIAPGQDRKDPEGLVSSVVLHTAGKLKTLVVFPSIFKGEHIAHPEMFTILKGKEICVKFDRPVALQIDGETVLGVTEYTVKAGVSAEKKAEAFAVR